MYPAETQTKLCADQRSPCIISSPIVGTVERFEADFIYLISSHVWHCNTLHGISSSRPRAGAVWLAALPSHPWHISLSHHRHQRISRVCSPSSHRGCQLTPLLLLARVLAPCARRKILCPVGTTTLHPLPLSPASSRLLTSTQQHSNSRRHMTLTFAGAGPSSALGALDYPEPIILQPLKRHTSTLIMLHGLGEYREAAAAPALAPLDLADCWQAAPEHRGTCSLCTCLNVLRIVLPAGDSGAGWADIGPLMQPDLPHTRFIFPTAPVVSCHGGWSIQVHQHNPVTSHPAHAWHASAVKSKSTLLLAVCIAPPATIVGTPRVTPLLQHSH
jgi:hypothetical protein